MFAKTRKLFRRTFESGTGAGAFLASALCFGMAFGSFYGVLNNYLVQIQHFNEYDRGILEFFRETPGLFLIVILALMHRFSEWKVLRTGLVIGMLASCALMFVGANRVFLTVLVIFWSAGEHILMPVRNSLSMHLAKPGMQGRSLGLTSSVGYTGQLVGALAAAALFYFGTEKLAAEHPALLYNLAWLLIGVFLFGSFCCIATQKSDIRETVRRPRLYFNRKYFKFYMLELFYGARKQIFLTFAPFVLILIYGFDTRKMALLTGVCAAVNIFAGPLVGKLIDRIGYRNTMIYDTVFLFFVCLVYGFAPKLFPLEVAYYMVIANYIFDAVISNASLASSIYVKAISDTPDEVTSTLTTGISINHLISVLAALAGGWIWREFGVGVLFTFAAVMAVCNTLYAITIPKSQFQNSLRR
ncbi:MAG: MFS transporter [Victivallaceae bacterium]